MITLEILGSGSDGNSTVITYEDKHTKQSIIMDCGVVKESKMDIDWKHVTGIYITHSHSDHIKTLNSVLKVCDVPVWVTKPEYLSTRYCNVVDSLTAYPQDVRFAYPNESIQDGIFRITPLVASHDTENPVHYLIQVKGKRIFYGCDTCNISMEVLEQMCMCDLVMIECNYDEGVMLTDTIDGFPLKEPYPPDLKYRIENMGHMSVQQIRNLMLMCPHPHFVLGHISKTYNTPDIIKKKLYANRGFTVIEPDNFPVEIVMNRGKITVHKPED